MKTILAVLAVLLLAAPTVAVTRTLEAEGLPPHQLDGPKHQEKAPRLHAVQQKDGIMLKWRAVRECDGYRIYHDQRDDLQAGSPSFDVDAAQTSELFSDVQPGEHYSFRICALHGGSEGPLSARVTVRMKGHKPAVQSDTAQKPKKEKRHD